MRESAPSTGMVPTSGSRPPGARTSTAPTLTTFAASGKSISPRSISSFTLASRRPVPKFSTVDAAVREWNIAREVGDRISVHVGVGGLGNHGLLQTLGQRVRFGSDTKCMYCCTLSDTEMKMI